VSDNHACSTAGEKDIIAACPAESRAGKNRGMPASGQFQSPDWASSTLWIALFDAKTRRRKDNRMNLELMNSGTQFFKTGHDFCFF
jgi:hypothetical protein